jgi:hypothetical protein
MKRLSLVAVTALAAGLLGGCNQASSSLVPLEQEAHARLLQPVPEQSVIYVLRDFGDIWTGQVNVLLNGREMGATAPNTYFRWEVAAREHVIVSATTPPAVLKLKTEPGGVYFVWQDINPGFLRPRSSLHQVDSTTAQHVLGNAVQLAGK